MGEFRDNLPNMIKTFIALCVAVCHAGLWCYDTARPGNCSDTFDNRCRSLCNDKQACFEIDRRFTNGSHSYIRGCWEQGSDDALKRTGCMSLSAETDISDEAIEEGAEAALTRESLCVRTCTTNDCNNNLEFADEVFSSGSINLMFTFRILSNVMSVCRVQCTPIFMGLRHVLIYTLF